MYIEREIDICIRMCVHFCVCMSVKCTYIKISVFVMYRFKLGGFSSIQIHSFCICLFETMRSAMDWPNLIGQQQQ